MRYGPFIILVVIHLFWIFLVMILRESRIDRRWECGWTALPHRTCWKTRREGWALPWAPRISVPRQEASGHHSASKREIPLPWQGLGARGGSLGFLSGWWLHKQRKAAQLLYQRRKSGTVPPETENHQQHPYLFSSWIMLGHYLRYICGVVFGRQLPRTTGRIIRGNHFNECTYPSSIPDRICDPFVDIRQTWHLPEKLPLCISYKPFHHPDAIPLDSAVYVNYPWHSRRVHVICQADLTWTEGSNEMSGAV